jgi:hypothetical protein
MHLMGHELDAAEQAFQSAMTHDHNFGETYGGLAIVAALKGQRQEADEFIRTAAKLDKRGSNLGVAVVLLRSGARSLDAAVVREALPGFMTTTLSGAAKQAAFKQLLQHAKERTNSPSR